jgi:hypothetical protein
LKRQHRQSYFSLGFTMHTEKSSRSKIPIILFLLEIPNGPTWVLIYSEREKERIMPCQWSGPPNSPEAAWEVLTRMNAYSIALGLILTMGSTVAQVPQVCHCGDFRWSHGGNLWTCG